MTIVRIGATKKYSEGWKSAFGKGKKQTKPATASKKGTAKKATAKKKTSVSAKKKPATKAKKKSKK